MYNIIIVIACTKYDTIIMLFGIFFSSPAIFGSTGKCNRWQTNWRSLPCGRAAPRPRTLLIYLFKSFSVNAKTICLSWTMGSVFKLLSLICIWFHVEPIFALHLYKKLVFVCCLLLKIKCPLWKFIYVFGHFNGFQTGYTWKCFNYLEIFLNMFPRHELNYSCMLLYILLSSI